MQVSEEKTMSKPYSDDEKPQSHPQQLEPEENELGLGFQSSDSSPPCNTDPVLDPPPTTDDLHQQNRETIGDEEVGDQQETVNEEVENQHAINEELYYQRMIMEEFQKLAMEENREEDDRRGRNEDQEVFDNWNDGTGGDEVGGYGESKNVDVGFFDRNEIYGNGKSENEDEEGFGFGGDSASMEGSKDGKYRRYQYPLRPDAEDCSYYMKTGNCKFGSNCKFNHPLRRRNQPVKERVRDMEENTERAGQVECKYYLTSGGCKFGKACRYNHGRGKPQVSPVLELNFLGLPIRLGEKECPYYMRNGSCKYGSNCRFNHPDPTAVGGGDPPGYGNNGSVSLQGGSQSSVSSWSSPKKLNETTPFVPMMFPPTQGIPSSNAEWNGYKAPAYGMSEKTLPTPPAFAMNSTAIETNFYPHQQQMVVEDHPERPGQPDCSYFMKTGVCKFGFKCKFHHPKSRIPRTTQCNLSDKGLPLRPDQNICSHYTRYGICKFGPACKFDHPENYEGSASSDVSGPDPPLYMNSVMADGATMASSGNGN